MLLKQAQDYLVYLVVRVFICIIQAMRMETGRQLTTWLAWLACDVLRLRGDVVAENLEHAFPGLPDDQRRRLTRQMWEHLFLLVLEVAHSARKIHETNWRQFVRLKHVDRLVSVLWSGRPVIMITGHFGNFEVGAFLLGVMGYPLNSVARTLDNPYLDRFVARFRGATGQRIIPKSGGYDQILEVLGRRSRIMAFLADQAAGPKGCWVDFFGRPASTYKAIALLSLEHDAPMAVCYARRLGRPLHFEMIVADLKDPRQASQDAGAVHDLTQWYTSKLEEGIRLAPEQYWWVHRRWKDHRAKRRPRQKSAA